MHTNRRNFVVTTALVAGGTLVGGFPVDAAEPLTDQAGREVSAFVARYGELVGMKRPAGRSVQLEVKVRSQSRFVAAFDTRKVPFEKMYVGPNNSLKFNHRGVDFEVSNRV